MPKGWFGPKIVGYGISPRSWQGWLATALFVAGLIGLLTGVTSNLSGFSGLSPDAWRLALGTVWLGLYFALVRATYKPDA